MQGTKLFLGVGHEVALQWYKTGHRSLEDVFKHETLTTAQKVGIEFYHDFLEKYGDSF
jgi:Fingers domain of DNA polymerase lambda